MISRKSVSAAAVLVVLSACLQPSVFCFPDMPSGRGAASASAFAEKYIRTELYFGLARKSGPNVTESEFQAFVDEFVTPRFPSGLTILDALGQWREDDSKITKEGSKVLILIYRKNERRAANAGIEEIRSEYKKRFSQQSVLRVDTRKGVSVDF